MRKWSTYNIVAILIALIVNKATAQSVSLLKTTYLKTYPSASGIAFKDDKLYIMGDDATQLLVVTTDHVPIDSVKIFQQNGYRIDYRIKPDLESLTFCKYKRKEYLVAMPSFSSVKRNTLYIFPLSKIYHFKTITSVNPIHHLKSIGINEPNVEGSTVVNKNVVVSNRANFANSVNYLVSIPIKRRSLKKNHCWKKTAVNFIGIDSAIGISGLEYSADKNMLFFTASTEVTTSANADGAIGNSYLGYFNNYSKQTGTKSITPDKLINLSKELKIGNQKIEGICIESQTDNSFIFHLVTDNDDGKSTIYKVQLTL